MLLKRNFIILFALVHGIKINLIHLKFRIICFCNADESCMNFSTVINGRPQAIVAIAFLEKKKKESKKLSEAQQTLKDQCVQMKWWNKMSNVCVINGCNVLNQFTMSKLSARFQFDSAKYWSGQLAAFLRSACVLFCDNDFMTLSHSIMLFESIASPFN